MFVVALCLLVVVFIAALVMAHVALPEMRQGHTLFAKKDGDPKADARASRLRVPLGWSEPVPGPRHAR